MVSENSHFTDNHTFTAGAICDQMIANFASTSETARWLQTVTGSVSRACFSNAACSTLIYICTHTHTHMQTDHQCHTASLSLGQRTTLHCIYSSIWRRHLSFTSSYVNKNSNSNSRRLTQYLHKLRWRTDSQSGSHRCNCRRCLYNSQLNSSFHTVQVRHYCYTHRRLHQHNVPVHVSHSDGCTPCSQTTYLLYLCSPATAVTRPVSLIIHCIKLAAHSISHRQQLKTTQSICVAWTTLSLRAC